MTTLPDLHMRGCTPASNTSNHGTPILCSLTQRYHSQWLVPRGAAEWQ